MTVDHIFHSEAEIGLHEQKLADDHLSSTGAGKQHGNNTEHSFFQEWHPIDDQYEYYWPRQWNSERRFQRTTLLFAFEQLNRR